MLYIEELSTDIGELVIGCSDKGLRFIQHFGSKAKATSWLKELKAQRETSGANALTKQTVKDIKAYLNGQLTKWNVALDLEGGTELQRNVWNTIYSIPYGQTITYTELAKKVNKPKAIRAAASACGKNPIPLVIPCHRVLAKDGGLGGFGWGVDIKRQLLTLEKSA